MVRPHLLVIPFPAQGHVMPLMELSHNLVDQGFKITFVNTDFNHKRVVAALSSDDNSDNSICLVSIPDGMGPEEDRNQIGKLSDAMAKAMPGYLEELISKINTGNNEDRITYIVADFSMGWALEVAHKLSIGGAAFWTASGQLLAELLQIPKLIADGVLATDDGMGPEEDRNQIGKLSDTMAKAMPGYLEELISKINTGKNEDRITYVVADFSMGWALEVAHKLSIGGAAFWTASGQLLAELLHIPKLIADGVFATDGTLIKTEMIQLSPIMPATNPAHFPWFSMGDLTAQKSIFNLTLTFSRVLQLAQCFLCNSFYELEPSAFAMIPNIQPIGPLNASSQLAQFWPEDLTCLSWLDQQAPKSVIYVAFGSITIMEKRQFDELALGLELSGQPFLWVVRPDLTSGDVYLDGFQARVRSRGRMVGWAPQRKVLAHPSIACFVTHCGWNSTMEGLSLGIPFLTWPYFSDQFVNRSYICDVWNVGLSLTVDENGIIAREEIKEKLAALLGDKEIKDRSLYLKQIAEKNVSTGGASLKNFEKFVQGIKN